MVTIRKAREGDAGLLTEIGMCAWRKAMQRRPNSSRDVV